jgi:predicted 3-demethylubiquinone-9 3-methyltransferase (glyoxalase superfamily)
MHRDMGMTYWLAADERGDVRPMSPYRLSIRGMPARLTVTDHSFVREAPMSKLIQRITPFLWFDSNAEEAAKFYVSIFKNSRIGSTARYDDEGAKAAGRPKGSVMTVAFVLEGQEFTALNGGPLFKFTEAVSFVVNCETQDEVDHFWEKLSAGGQQVQCGWLKDRFGVSWQVVPTVLIEMLHDKDPEKSRRVMSAMLKMKKIDIAGLRNAYQGRSAPVP